jgi:gamma-glutamyl-gamma-aminobutyrate hydrolase PuuD
MPKQRKVYIVTGAFMGAVTRMFTRHGYMITTMIEDADLIQFTGGSDIDPSLYNQHPHQRTYSSPQKDKQEVELYKMGLAMGIPMAGICRGGQLLNVLNGGTMYQDVDAHGVPHSALIMGNNIPVWVTSMHHQMMNPNYEPEAECHILMTADEANHKEYMSSLSNHDGKYLVKERSMVPNTDIEAVYYGQTNCLCYQPHPEMDKENGDCERVYFQFIDDYLFADDDESGNTVGVDDIAAMELADCCA